MEGCTLPDAEKIMKHVRDDKESEQCAKAYEALCEYINSKAPFDLKDGVEVRASFITPFHLLLPLEQQRVLKKISMEPGYVISIAVEVGITKRQIFVEIPTHVWEWRDFWKIPSRQFDIIVIRVRDPQ